MQVVQERETTTNVAPVATSQPISVYGAGSFEINLAGTDPDGDSLIYALASRPANGTTILNGNIVTYTPPQGFNGLDSFTFTVSDGTETSAAATVSITVIGEYIYDLPPGWSMISLPYEVDAASLDSLFPTAVSLFEFDGGYQSAAKMEIGKGYWVNLSTASTAAITGMQQIPLSVVLPSAWSMVGPGHNTVAVSSLGDHVISVFGFEAGYSPSANLEPGRGYWANLSTADTLDLSGSANAKSVVGRPKDEVPLHAVLWAKSADRQQMLHLGVPPEEMQALPPVPPPDLFDVRVEVDGVGSWQVPDSSEPRDYRLQVQGGMMQLGWQISPAERGFWQLVVNEKAIDLEGEGMLDGVATTDEVFVRRTLLPRIYVVGQNYPNPFTPTTTIQYSLPEAGLVSLKIYNMAGQVMRQLVYQQQSAGSYQAVWDGLDESGEPTANGVYIYELRAGAYRALRKMLLLK